MALGAPAGISGEPIDWASLSARRAEEWQTLAGIGAGRASQLVAFFTCDGVHAQAVRLHAAGVQGF